MRRTTGLNLLLSVVLLSPLLLGLAVYPQNPDGAEMLNTALYGGVMHPSGMPLQAWINRAAVVVSPFSPGWTLSFVSWLGHLGSVFILLQWSRRLRLSPEVCLFTVVSFAFLPVLVRLALQPEKYTWLCFTLLMALYAFWLAVSEEKRRWLLASGIASGLVIAQHSAGLIVLPGLLIVLGHHVRHHRSSWFSILGSPVLLRICNDGILLEPSCFAPETDLVTWVDWGHLESVTDVWRHFRRADYSTIQLHQRSSSDVNLSGLSMALREGMQFPFGIIMIFIGLFAAFKHQRVFAMILSLTGLGALLVLKLAKLPADDLQTALGYAERYPTLAWPMAAVLMGFGLEWTLKGLSPLRTPVLTVALASVVYLIVVNFSAARAVNNNLIELYRREVVRELPSEHVLFSMSDYEFFYGFPCADRPCYPLKNMFAYDWYRTAVAPVLAPAIRPVLNSLGLGWSLADFFRATLQNNLTLASTSATAMLPLSDIMNSAEQVGVVWLFKSGPQQLYSERIVQNSVHICKALEEAWTGIPDNGNYFAQEILQNFRFAIQGAADYLNATGRTRSGQKANELAQSLKAQTQPTEWVHLCREYQGRLLN